MIRQLVGDCRVTLPTLDAGVAQACITSPPYYGLRDYGTPPLVWGGDAECAHEWGALMVLDKQHQWKEGHAGLQERQREGGAHSRTNGQNCACGAWLGSLGLEPTPELFIEHLVECFRYVRRVLADTGVVWLNLGDSYAGSGNGAHDYRDRTASHSLSLNPDKYKGQRPLQRVGPQEHTEGHGRVQGLKPKDLLMMPFRVAMALQADGWWLRSVIPWLKRNSMPESVTDRPSTSVEYVFLLAKSARYFWDADAVRMPNNDPERKVFTPGRKQYLVSDTSGREMRNHGLGFGKSADGSGRNRRNSDWFFESWQGLMLDEADDPLALVVNPTGFKQAHFATFPAKLVEPMVKASTRPGDTVLDLFGGAGTVGLVADRLERNAILCELKREYASMGANRIVDDAPMFSEVAGLVNDIQPTESVQDKQAASGLRRYAGFNARWDAKEAAD